MTVYRLLHLLKFAGVSLYAGGLVARFLATSPSEQKRAVHSVASPGLAIIWIAGYLLSLQLNVGLTELWILGGIILSAASQMALVAGVSRERSGPREIVAAAGPFVLVLVLMVFRPTWQSVRP